MKILFINNFLFPLGGVESYMISLADQLVKRGHTVEFFGMEDERNVLKNSFGLYSRHIDLKTSKLLELFYYPFSIIYSIKNKFTLKKLLDKYKPDIVHMNSINFNLTTSIFDPLLKLKIPIVKTIHDSQIACSNHRFFIPHKNLPCMKCSKGNFTHSLINKCIENSYSKSFVAMIESYFNKIFKRYHVIDKYIFPSNFMLESHLKLNLPRENLTFIPNFARFERKLNLNGINNLVHFKKYNLYFGRLSVEKGIHLIFKLAKDFPNENFVFVGDGPMKEQVPINLKNVQLISFQNGDNLINIIQNADLSLSPSLWYENSPLNVIESLNLGTPVLGSNIGGIPEFIENEVNGLLFEPNNYLDLKEKFRRFKYINPDNKISIKKILNVEEYTIIIEKLYKELI